MMHSQRYVPAGAVTAVIAVALLWGRGCSDFQWTSLRHSSTGSIHVRASGTHLRAYARAHSQRYVASWCRHGDDRCGAPLRPAAPKLSLDITEGGMSQRDEMNSLTCTRCAYARARLSSDMLQVGAVHRTPSNSTIYLSICTVS